MKKITFTGFFMSVLMASGAAFAVEDSAILTTKNYVDDGLRYVYGVKADKDDVYTKDEADNKFLTSVDLSGLDTTSYSGQNGVTVDGHNVKLNVTPETGSMYVYTSDGWSELEVQDEWSADIFNPSQSGD